ncbi:MAG: hypothetical protein KDA51_01950, partial [Planctomycetales bacterium]|nr:hypothetical protein [Planctomycetales bacterium]
PTQNLNANPEEARKGLQELLQKLAKQEGIAREGIHVSLHNRMCITRVVTGNRLQVDEQLAEITDNSQHYLQLGLGEKLIGHSTVPIDESRQHGQVAIIKRGLIATIDEATAHAGLELLSVDGAMTGICRLTGVAGMDRTPLLLVWLGSTGAEIGISYKGRLQLGYHSRECVDLESTALTIGKHLKRLRRFCDRYRQVEGKSDLRRVLVLGNSENAEQLKGLFAQYDFEQVFTLEDLSHSDLADRLGGNLLDSGGAASALGGLLVHLEADVLPTTDVFDQYLMGKPQTLSAVIFRDGWPLLVAASILILTLCCGWMMSRQLRLHEAQHIEVASGFESGRVQLQQLDSQRKVLKEYNRLVSQVTRPPLRGLVTHIANCLPADCRLNWCALDSQGGLILKGMMLQGDQTYDILKALAILPEISEVTLESVEKSSSQGRTSTHFEIRCETVQQSPKQTPPTPLNADATQLSARHGAPSR